MTLQVKFQQFLAKYFPRLKKFLTRIEYDYISRLDTKGQLLFMNYGFVGADSSEMPAQLSSEYEEHRYQVQLYHHVAKAVDWNEADVLEVGSGRGGGSSYLFQSFKPRSFIGVDISEQAVDFCKRNYSISKLSFENGNAEEMRFADNSFDILINVESSLYYPRVESFLREVVRVLKPSGYFLYADIRFVEEVETWKQQLQLLKLNLIEEQDITPNVVKALDLDYERKRNLIAKHIPRFLQGAFGNFAGISGGGFYRGTPKNGERVYLNHVFQKPA